MAATHDPAPCRPRVTYDTYRSASIDAYYEDVAAIWQRDNSERSVLDLWLHLSDHTSRLGAAVRRHSPGDLTEYLSDTAVWLMSVIAQCRDSRNPADQSFRFSQPVSDIIWNKYPGMCPGCFDAWLISCVDLKPEEVTPRELDANHPNLRRAIRERAERYAGPTPCRCLSRSPTARQALGHKDAVWLERLETMLKPLVRNLTLSVWDDRKIRPGQLWREEIASALSRARVAVLLVSADFLASDFIAEQELPPLLDAARRRGTRIIWVLVGACLYEEAGLGGYQAAHDPSEPLEGMSIARYHAVLVQISEAIKRAAQGES